MTLFRQIALLVSVMIVLLLGSVTWNNFRHSGEYLQGQLRSNAQDMSTVLGIAISNHSGEIDAASLESLFNAFFDSGYYSDVRLVSLDGGVIHAKSQQVSVVDVPPWFVDFVPLQPATGVSQVMKGWSRYGTLSVTLHPGYAYASLYNNFTAMLQWFFGFTVVGLLTLWRLLFLLLKPLRTVCMQADAIQDHQFIIQEHLPRTYELRKVSMAVNRMVAKVQSVFDDQTDILKRYHDLLYQDALTGLGNRRFLLMKLNEICEDESADGGWMLIFHLDGLAEMNQVEGYQATDEFINQFAQQLRDQVGGHQDHQCVRLKPSEFVVYLLVSEEAAMRLVEAVFGWMRDVGVAQHPHCRLWLCAGVEPIYNGCNVSSLLSNLDFTLVQAKGRGAYGVVRAEPAVTMLPQGKNGWRSLLTQSLTDKRFFLVGQTVKNVDDTTFQRELLVRLQDQGDRVISAGIFMPVATELGMDFAIDKAVFEMAMGLHNQSVTEPVALNLSRTVLDRAAALSEFERFLHTYSRVGLSPLYVEISHFDLINRPETAMHIAGVLKLDGHRLGIDRLDLGEPLELLKAVLPSYVKISASQLADMADSEIEAGFTALRTLVGSLDIKLVAVGVDSAELYQRLMRLGVDAMQGNYIGEPERVS
jgi:EAL domain-containing protein (putative c-di-GMP-specific phosphodiesterase class I)/GGDEF domain-containing protein